MYAQECCNVKVLCLAICWSHPQCILLIAACVFTIGARVCVRVCVCVCVRARPCVRVCPLCVPVA